MSAKELIEAAKRLRECHGDWRYIEGNSTFHEDVIASCDHILATVREDDDEPVTREWVDAETPLVNRSTSPYSRNYLIRGGVRLVASAKPGGFEPCVLWCGSGNEFYEIGTPTRGEVRSMLRGLRVPFNK